MRSRPAPPACVPELGSPRVTNQTPLSYHSNDKPRVAATRWCSRTSTAWPVWTGMATSSPARSAEKEMVPGPTASSITTGRPPRMRSQAPARLMAETSTEGSCQSRLCWGKKTPSPAGSFTSAAGVSLPSTCMVAPPICTRVMSGMAGSSVHPEVVRRATSRGAPQSGQVDPAPEETLRQYGQV